MDVGGRYSKVFRRMWTDDKFRRLSKPQPCGQALWMRFLCGPELGPIPGLFSAREPGLADAMGWGLKPFRESFQELLRNGLAEADWEAGLVWVPNAIKYNEPANPNVVKSWEDAWAELPECQLKSKAHSILCAYLETRGESFASTFRNHCRNHSPNGCPNQEQDQEQEQEQEQEPPIAPQGGRGEVGLALLPVEAKPGTVESEDVRSVVTYYQKLHPRSCPSLTPKSTEWRKIKARLAEGSTVADMCKAIDGYHRHPWHVENGQLGLELIMRDASHVSQGIAWAEQKGAGPPRGLTVGQARAEVHENAPVGRQQI